MRVVSLCILAVCLSASLRAEVRVVGSDLMGKDFGLSLTDYARRNDIGVKIDMAGSVRGLEQLQAGEADLGLLVFRPDEKLPNDAFVVLPVAYHTAVVVVPAALPLTQITFGQLNAIYADEADSNLKRWYDLGVVGEWATNNILPNITGPSDSVSYDLFRYTVLRKPVLKPTVSVQDTFDATLRRIIGQEGGVAIMPMLPENQVKIKAVLVARSPKDVAFGATEDNIHSGDYPIRLPVYLVFRKDKAKSMQVMLRYFFSEDAAAAWIKARLFPLPIQARNQQIFDLEVL